jgi:hypothetical protein
VITGPLLLGLSLAHEPIFGLGAHTLYKGGYGLEVEVESGKAGDDREDILAYHLNYGVTADFTIGLVVPHFIKKEAGNSSSSGLGDLSLKAKYRFIRIDEPGATTGVALNIASKFPSGDETKEPALGSGSADFLAGLAVSREGLRHYFFSDITYLLKTEANSVRKGNVFFFDIAYGIRPLRTEYLKPDLVLIVEFNYEKEESTKTNRVKDIDTGGETFFVSPGFLLSYRNVMLKGGVQIPVYRNMNGAQDGVDYRALVSIELHL